MSQRPNAPVRVLVLGAGGHGQVVADILWQMHTTDLGLTPIGYMDDNPTLVGCEFLGLPVLGITANLDSVPHDAVVIAVGDNNRRRDLYDMMCDRGERLAACVHPRAIIACNVEIGPGAMICAGAIVNPYSSIGANAILNTACTVDHHNHIGAHAHVAPGVHLGGGVTIGEGALVGIGATVIPGRNIGAWSVVGAGALVHGDVPAGVTVMGVPARIAPGPSHLRADAATSLTAGEEGRL